MNLRRPAPDPPPARMIHGVASSERVVSDEHQINHAMAAGGCPLHLPVPLLREHNGKAIGEVVYLRWIGAKLYCRATIFHTMGGEQAWREIVQYKLRALSCTFETDHHRMKLRADVGVVKEVDQYRIKEISVCQKPANKDCYFAIFAGGSEGRVEGQRSLSEHRRINARARKLLGRLEKEFPSSSRRSAPQKFSPADIQRLWAQRKKGV
jgi:hypothetical protein